MRKLYHFWLSPYCRKVRLHLKEKALDFELVLQKVWEREPEFLELNPTGQVPVLIEHDGRVLADSLAICEFLDEVYPNRMLIGFDPPGRAETRRLVAWFDLKMGREVSDPLVYEKVLRRFLADGQPDSATIRVAHQNLRQHMAYIGHLAEHRKWLGGEDFGLADIAAAAHLSCLDYLGDVPWDDFPLVKDWYARLKSRPSFRPLLADHIPGLPPPRHYADLDF